LWKAHSNVVVERQRLDSESQPTVVAAVLFNGIWSKTPEATDLLELTLRSSVYMAGAQDGNG